MKKIVLALSALLPAIVHAQSVGIGTTSPHKSARLEVWDTVRGILIPRLTTSQRDAINNPAHALMIFNVDSFCLQVYDTVTARWYNISCPRYCRIEQCVPVISGPSFVCAGDTITYSASGCSSVFYSWTVPSGWTIVSGQGTPSLSVVPDTSDGSVGVRGCNLCGCGAQINVNVVADSCSGFCVAVGDTLYDVGVAVVEVSDGLVVAGNSGSFGSTSDVYVFKLDAGNVLQWSQVINIMGAEFVTDMIKTSDGGFVVGGRTQIVPSANTYQDEGILIKLDSSGNHIWIRAFTSFNNFDWVISVTETPDSGLAAAVVMETTADTLAIVKMDASSNVQWIKGFVIVGLFPANGKLITTADGGLLFAGYSGDIVVVKMDSQANVEWAVRVGGTGSDRAFSVTQTTDGGYVVAGSTNSFGQGDYDVYVVKLDSAGSLEWTLTVGGDSIDYANSVIQLSDGNLVVVGTTRSFGQGNGDVYVLKINTNGNLLWTRTIGGPAQEAGLDVIETSGGRLVIVGVTGSVGNGNTDAYIVRLNANGTIGSCPAGCIVGSGGVAGSGGTITPISLPQYTVTLSIGGGTTFSPPGLNGTVVSVCP